MNNPLAQFLKWYISGNLAHDIYRIVVSDSYRKRKLVFVFLICFFTQSAFAQSTMTESFESHVPKKASSSKPFRLAGSNNATVSRKYSRSGSKSLRSFIPISPSVSDPRSEIQHKGWTGSPSFVQSEHKFFTTRSFGFSFYFPSNFQDFDPVEESLMQWKNSNKGAPCSIGFPGFSIRLRKDNLSYNIKYGKSACSGKPKTKSGNLNKKIKKGVWHNFVVEIYNDYREKGGNGYVKIWYSEGGTINKKSDLVVNYKGPVGYEGKEGPFLKLGLYKSQWKKSNKRDDSKDAGVSKREMYIDDVFITEGSYGGSPAPPKNDPPTANAGKDVTITLPDNSVTINGKGTSTVGINAYSWKKVSGPNSTVKKKNQAKLIAEDLEEGRYIFRLTVTDKNGNKDSDDVKVTVKAAAVQADAGKDITITLPDNSVTIIGKGASGESYSWAKVSGPNSTVRKKNQAKLIAEDLEEGKYVFKFTVTDKNGNKASDNVKITVKAAAVQADAGKDITITLPVNSVTINGKGTSGESYSWEKVSGPNSTVRKKNQAKLVAEDLEEGKYVYRLTVTDKKGNKASDEVKVTVKAAAVQADAGKDITITLPVNSVTINGKGTSGESYSWEKVSGPNSTVRKKNQAKLVAEDLEEGKYIYRLTVTDKKGNKASDEVKMTVKAAEVVQTAVVVNEPSISADIVNATCSSSDGSISLNIKDGSAPFQINWSNGATGKTATELSGGEYSVKVTDKLGNSVSKAFTVESINANLKITSNVKNTSCSDKNGSIKVEVSGGVEPYNYEWSTNGRLASLSELSAGSYSLVVSDQNGCRKKFSFEVEVDPGEVSHEVTSEVLNASCAGNDGSIALAVNGSQGPYNYSWAHGANGATLNSLENGSYQVTITDKHGCFMDKVYTVNQDSGPTNPIIRQSGDSLFVENQAANYQWYKDSVAIDQANQQSTKITEAGVYSVQISNDKNCQSSSDLFHARDPFSGTANSNFKQVQFYPIPVVSDINVRILLTKPADASISIYDFQGRVVLTRELGTVNSQILETLSIAQYPAGPYLIRAKANNEIITRRFVKY